MDELAAIPRPLFLAFACALGLVIGSFLNVVIHRMPRDESLVRPGSHCPACGSALRWFDNVPLLSYAWLRGRCRTCGVRISLRYPVVELATGALFAALAWRRGLDPMLPIQWAFGAALIAAAVIDFDHQIIPDEISLGGLVAALVLVPSLQALLGAPLSPALAHSLAGAALGGGLFWLVGFSHARICSALGREFEHWPGPGESLPSPRSLDYWTWFPGVGFGDVKLLAMIGAVLGPAAVLHTILAASVAGLLLGLAWAAATRSFRAPFGFAPALAAGAWIAMLAPGGVAG